MMEEEESKKPSAAASAASPTVVPPGGILKLPALAQLAAEASDEGAIEDSDEADEELVNAQRNLMQARLQRRKSAGRLFQKVIPFHWAPMLTPLTESDIETSVVLEELAFEGDKRGASREQLEYRIKSCGNICFGLFNTYRPSEAKGWSIGTMRHCRAVETGREDNAKHVLFAHIIATLGDDPVVTDKNVGYPDNWRVSTRSYNSPLGHRYFGRTICLHSFAVCPEVQGIGIGKTTMKSYLQLMNESNMADRVALVCNTSLVDFFKRCGFRNTGESECASSSGKLYNMVCDLPGTEKQNS